MIGVSADELTEMLDFRGNRSRSDPNSSHFGAYGLSFQLFGHLAAVIIGIEPLGYVSVSADGYAVRHLLSASLVVITSVAVGLTTWLLTGQKRISFFSGVVLMSIPPFFGHGFFNPKDIPVACGYTLVSLAASAAINQLLSRDQFRRGFRWAMFFGSVFGIWICVGTRPGTFFLILLTISWTLLIIVWKFSTRFESWRAIRLVVWWPLSIFVGLLLVTLTNPCVIANYSSDCRWGVEILPRIFTVTSSFPSDVVTLAAGRLFPAIQPDFWYLPLVLWAGLPILILVLASIGFLFFWECPVNRNLSRRISESVHETQRRLVVGAPTLFQLCFGPIMAVLLRSTIYDLQRQHLYVYPAVAVGAGLGLFVVAVTSRSILTSVLAGVTIAGVAAATVTLPTIETLRLFPYSYVYVNVIAAREGYLRHWETDYWGTGYREALKYVPAGAPLEAIQAPWLLTPYLDEQRDHRSRAVPNVKYVLQWHRPTSGIRVPLPGCNLHKTVTRLFRGEYVPISYVSVCPLGKDTGTLIPYDLMENQKPSLLK